MYGTWPAAWRGRRGSAEKRFRLQTCSLQPALDITVWKPNTPIRISTSLPLSDANITRILNTLCSVTPHTPAHSVGAMRVQDQECFVAAFCRARPLMREALAKT